MGFWAWAWACNALPRAWLLGKENGFRFLAAWLSRDESKRSAAKKIGSPDAGGT